MHRWCPVVILLLLPMAVPMDAAQETAWQTDPEGDFEYDVGDQAAPNKDDWGILDLVRMDLEETETDLIFTWQVADLTPRDPGTLMDQAIHYLRFDYGGLTYGVGYYRYYGDGSFQDGLVSSEYEEQAAFGTFSGRSIRTIEELEPEVDNDEGTIRVVVPREPIRDMDGAPLLANHTIDNAWMETFSIGGELANVGPRFLSQEDLLRDGDRMPDTDFAPPFTLEIGPEPVGHLSLESMRPYRASNGEATTFLYDVMVHNNAGFPDTAEFEVNTVTAPASWTVTFPSKAARLEPGESLELPVLLTVPFAHKHGETDTIEIVAQSRADPTARAPLSLGVHYIDPPQPAGHHNTVYLHKAEDCDGFMNSLETDPAAAEGPIKTCSSSGDLLTTTKWDYDFPLTPGLQLGIDMDMDAVGELAMVLNSIVPLQDVVITGALEHLRLEEDEVAPGFVIDRWIPTNIARIEPSTPFSFGPTGGSEPITTTITPLPEGDYIPWTEGTRLNLNIVVTATWPMAAEIAMLYPSALGVDPQRPTIDQGASATLPLLDFHDDVDQFFSGLSGIELYAEGTQQSKVNPGEIRVFEVTAENLANEAADVQLELQGSNREWATVLGDLQVRLAAGERRDLAIAVSPPDDAADEELVDLTLHASLRDDENIRSLIRLVAEVDVDEDHPDDLEKAASLDATLATEEAPGAGALSALAVLAAVLVVRRRRD